MNNLENAVKDRLTIWKEEEVQIRSKALLAGVSPLKTVSSLRGIDFLKECLDGKLSFGPIGKTFDFILIEAQEGRAVFQGTPKLDHYNPIGTVHGGWISTLLDSCASCAVHSLLPVGKVYTTAELKVNFVRPITTKVELVRAEGKIIHMGSRMATAEGRLMGVDGKLYAHCSVTCFIFDYVPG
ncbi:MAG: PaaI family thioesterase [Betaproteobacteria bacterium]|jgi:uncharacterized protein (TIGR00369 family)